MVNTSGINCIIRLNKTLCKQRSQTDHSTIPRDSPPLFWCLSFYQAVWDYFSMFLGQKVHYISSCNQPNNLGFASNLPRIKVSFYLASPGYGGAICLQVGCPRTNYRDRVFSSRAKKMDENRSYLARRIYRAQKEDPRSGHPLNGVT